MKILKFLAHVIKYFSWFVELAGIFIVLVFAMYSIVMIETGNIGEPVIAIKPFIASNEMAWFWIIVLCCWVLNAIIKLGMVIKNGIRDVKEKKYKITMKNIIKWFAEN